MQRTLPYHVSSILLMYVGLLLEMCANAQAQYRFDHWTADNGLPQNSVRDIVQTCDGYLWLATFDGLVRFDGVRFTVFNKSNSPGNVTNRFTQLFEDALGDLWAATEGGEVTRRHAGPPKSKGCPSSRQYTSVVMGAALG